MIAARVAAELKKEPGVQVETIAGGFGELSVAIDGQKVVATNPLWYPRPRKIIDKIRSLLAK